MTLPLSQDSPAESPRGDSRFSRFFKNLRGNDSRDSIDTRKQSQVKFKSPEYPSRPSQDSGNSRGLPHTPDVDVNQYFSQLHKTTGYDAKRPEDPRDLDTPEQRGMLGVYEDFMRAQRGKQWRDMDFDPIERDVKCKDGYSAPRQSRDFSRDLKLSAESRDLGTYDWSRDTDNTTLTPMTPHVPSSFYSLRKENPYNDGSRESQADGDKSREVYDYVNKPRSALRSPRDQYFENYDPPQSPGAADSRSSKASRVFFALTLTCLLIVLKTHVTTIILNYGIDDSQIYSQTACATLNTYAATTHFGPNLLYSSVTGQAAGHVGDMAQSLLPQSDVTMKTPEFVKSLLSQLKEDYIHSLTNTIDFGVDLTKNTTFKNARDAQSILSRELEPLQTNITVFEDSLKSLSETILDSPIFGLKQSDNSSQLNLDHLKSLNFTDVFFSDFLPLFASSSDVSNTLEGPLSSAKNAILTDFNNFNTGLRKLALNLPTSKAVSKQLHNSSYNQLFSTFQLCTKEDEIKEHYEMMEKSVKSKSGAIVVTFVVFAIIFLLITCFLELFGLVRKKKSEKVSYLRKLKLTETQRGGDHVRQKTTKSRDLIPFPHHLSTLTIVTVAVAVSCLCDLSLLTSLRISGGAQIEFVSDMSESRESPGESSGESSGGIFQAVEYDGSSHVTEPVEEQMGSSKLLVGRELKVEEDEEKPLTYAPVDYAAIFSTAGNGASPASSAAPSATVAAFASVATPVQLQAVQKSTEKTDTNVGTLHNISTDITRLIDSANIYLEGLQTNLATECLSFQSELIKGVNSTLSKLGKELNEAVVKRFGLEKGDLGVVNIDRFLSAVQDKSREAIAAGTAKQFQIDPKQAVAALSQAHIDSLPGFAPLQTKTTIATSLENLVGMMQKVVLSQQWFAVGLFVVWAVIMMTAGVRWIIRVKKEGGFGILKTKKWEV